MLSFRGCDGFKRVNVFHVSPRSRAAAAAEFGSEVTGAPPEPRSRSCNPLESGSKAVGLNLGGHQGATPSSFNFLPQRRTGSSHVIVTSHDEALIAAQDYRSGMRSLSVTFQHTLPQPPGHFLAYPSTQVYFLSSKRDTGSSFPREPPFFQGNHPVFPSKQSQIEKIRPLLFLDLKKFFK